MFHIKNIVSVAVIAFGLTVCFTTSVSAQKIPAGSYQQTCSDIKIDADLVLTASCQAKDAGAFIERASLLNYFVCVGDISNNDSRLTCVKDANSPQMKAAGAAVVFGIKNVFGLQEPPSQSSQFGWIKSMFKNGWEASFYKGWTTVDGIDFFQTVVARPANGKLRAEIINRAFMTVYGSEATSEQQAYWDSMLRKGNRYSVIVQAEGLKQNKNEITRKLLILRAYKAAFGRAPNAGDISFWFPRTENYSELIKAQRNWLYSPQGSKDLSETVKRALTDKYAKKSVSDADVKNAMIQYQQSKKIYDEM